MASDNSRDVRIEVAGGLCMLNFSPGYSTGREADLNPGIGFDVVSDVAVKPDKDGKYRFGSGVIGRSDAIRLRNMIDEFILEYENDEHGGWE